MSGNSYYNTDLATSRVNVSTPSFSIGNDLMKAGQVLGESMNYLRGKEIEDYKLNKDAEKTAEDKRRWDTQNTRAELQEKRAADEYERNIREKNVTNDALRAVIDPNGYKASKMADEQKAVEESYKLMSPEEVAAVKAQYDPAASGRGWVDTASSAKGVDVGRVLDTKSKQYEIAAKTPGTPEYVAAKKAELDLYRTKAGIDSGTRRADARFEKDLAYEFEGKKVAGMLNALNVDSTKSEQYIANDALRKNIEGKQEIYGNTYKSEIDKVFPTIESVNKNTEALKSRLTGNEALDRGLLMSIKANENKVATMYDAVDKVSLGKSGMGNSLKEVPEEVKGTRNTVKSKAEFTKDMLKAIGPNPSAEAVTVATQEIEKRYPKTNLSVEGYNQLAEQYGGKSIKTNDSAVAKENADAAVQVHKEKLQKQLMLNPVSVDDTSKSLDELFKISSPDVIGTGDEYELRNKIYSLKAKYQIPDKQMASIVDQSRGTYLAPWLGRVDEGADGKFAKEIEARVQALRPNKPN